jgi:integrase
MDLLNPKSQVLEGTVSVEEFRGKLRLKFRVSSKRYCLSLGLSDTLENRQIATAKAQALELEIISGQFDPSLANYQAGNCLTVIETIAKTQPQLNELWEQYVNFKSSQVEETTLRLNFNRVKSHISKLPTHNLEDANAIKDYLLANNSPYTVKRILTQINACCKWATQSKLISYNPFEGLAAEIKVNQESSEGDIDPFTSEERDIIIQAFSEHPTYHHYTNFVKFLFMTGCRTSEAVGLRWKHISADCSRITFTEAVVNVSSQKIRKGLKSQEKRTFPCNQSLKAFLKSIKPENVNPEAIVFTSLKGQDINAHTFNALCWKGSINKGKEYKGIVQQLADEGKISHYRPQYQTRHTFINLALDHGLCVQDVARLVGNSPEIIYKHYANNRRDLQVPEF